MLDSAGIVVIGNGLGHVLSPFTAVLLISALALASAIPAAPGNLGVYQLVVISVLGTAGIARGAGVEPGADHAGNDAGDYGVVGLANLLGALRPQARASSVVKPNASSWGLLILTEPCAAELQAARSVYL